MYTPGDNEWTDCHRANNGGYTPTERLAVIRQLFFSHPGTTLGGAAHVDFQSAKYPENVRWVDNRVVFGMLHVVGSNDDQAPWFTDRTDAAGAPMPETPAESADQAREYTAREAANLEWLDGIFDVAEQQNAPGVVIGMQADMWDSSAPESALTAFNAIKAVLAARTAEFGKPVLLLQGDSHLFKVDTPAGQPANLTRLVVEGSTNVPHEYLRLHVDPAAAQPFSCENVEFGTGTETPCPAPAGARSVTRIPHASACPDAAGGRRRRLSAFASLKARVAESPPCPARSLSPARRAASACAWPSCSPRCSSARRPWSSTAPASSSARRSSI